MDVNPNLRYEALYAAARRPGSALSELASMIDTSDEKEARQAVLDAKLRGLLFVSRDEASGKQLYALTDEGKEQLSKGPDAPRVYRKSSKQPPAPMLMRPKDVCVLLGIGRTKLHNLSENDPRFPRKVVLGARCVGWRAEAIHDYLRVCEQGDNE